VRLAILAAVLLLATCGDEGERVVLPEQVKLTLPQQCHHLYNVGRHREWADCIGVGYVSD